MAPFTHDYLQGLLYLLYLFKSQNKTKWGQPHRKDQLQSAITLSNHPMNNRFLFKTANVHLMANAGIGNYSDLNHNHQSRTCTEMAKWPGKPLHRQICCTLINYCACKFIFYRNSSARNAYFPIKMVTSSNPGICFSTYEVNANF